MSDLGKPPENDLTEHSNTLTNTRDKDGYRDGRSESDMLTVATDGGFAELVERTKATLESAVPPNTRRAYEGDLRRFAAWCTVSGQVAMPAAPETICAYMRQLADRGNKVSTIERALAAICTAHVHSGRASPWRTPAIKLMRDALRRELGVRPTKKRAADDEILRRVVRVIPGGRLGIRDRALLTLAWSGAFRRSEVVSFDVGDITRAPKGIVVLVRTSKTDQERRGEEVPVFFANDASCCPVR